MGEDPDIVVTLVTSDFEHHDLEALGDLVRRTLAAGRARLGPPTPGRRLIVVDRDTERGGGLVGDGISLLFPQAPGGEATSSEGVVIVHEWMHLWNRADEEWLTEGLTRYLEAVVSHELDGLPHDAVGGALVSLGRSYLQRAESGTIAQSKGSTAYQAGAMAAMCLDGAMTAAGQSLWSAHQAARAGSPAGEVLPAATLLEEVDHRDPLVGQDLRRWLHQEGPLDLTPCFGRLGWVVDQGRYVGFTPRALAVEVLRVTSYDPRGTTIFRAGDDSLLKDGDLVLTAQRQPISRIEELDWLLVEVAPGESFVLEVLRHGETTPVSLTMPTLEASDRVERSRLTLQASP